VRTIIVAWRGAEAGGSGRTGEMEGRMMILLILLFIIIIIIIIINNIMNL